MDFFKTFYFLLFVLALPGDILFCQDNWDWRDPVDLGFIDLADNKLILYNAIGAGLVSILNSQTEKDSSHHWSFYGEYFEEYKRSPLSNVYMIRSRISWPIKKFLRMGGDMKIYGVFDEDIRTGGLGVELTFQWHIYSGRKIRLAYDNGVGPNYFLQAFPAGGTRFNFSTHYGLTIQIRIPGERWVTLGIRNLHVSNADIKGVTRNPALDGLGLIVGIGM